MRYVPYEIVLERQEGDVSYYRVTDWEPIHLAFVPDPADPTVGVNRNENYNHELNVIINNSKEKKMEDGVVTTQTTPVTDRKLTDAELEALTNKIKTGLKDEQKAAVERAKQEGGATALQNIAGIMQYRDLFREELKEVCDLDKEADSYAFKLKATERDFADLIMSKKKEKKPADTFDLPERDKKKFSSRRLIMSCMPDSGEKAEHERAVCSAYAKERGLNPRGIIIPRELLSQDRTMTVASSTGGGNLVGTNLLANEFIPLAGNVAIADKLGCVRLPGLVGDVAIPTQTGAITLGWMTDESTGADASDMTVGQKTMSPQTGHGTTSYSRKLLLQSTPAIDGLINTDLQRIANLGVDKAVFHGRGHTTYGEPQGIYGTSGIGLNTVKTSWTWADILAMETAVAAANLEVNTSAYITTPTIRGSLKGTLKASGVSGYIWENNEVNGYRAFASNQITAGFVFFGDFSQVVIGEWSGLDIVVDAVTSKVGLVYVTVFVSVDVVLRYAGAFANYKPS